MIVKGDDYEYIKYKHGQHCDNCATANSGNPFIYGNICRSPTKCHGGLFTPWHCEGAAHIGQTCKWTGCAKEGYCDGEICQDKKKQPKLSDNPGCLKHGEECELKLVCKGEKDKSDNCCWPMSCRNGKCDGPSPEGVQCATNTCKEGLICNSYFECQEDD